MDVGIQKTPFRLQMFVACMMFRLSPLIAVMILPLAWALPGEGTETDLLKHFEQSVRPLLESRCLKCHGEQKQEGGLRLDSRQGVLRGGESGPAIVAGHPDESLLMEAVNNVSLEMPPDGKLSASEIAALSVWIASGAHWPETLTQLRESSGAITDDDREWWAFQPLEVPIVPDIAGDEWSQNPIDRFVLARLAEHEMRPAPQADRQTLVRRLYFDLLGLPPPPEEVDRFVSDDSPDAWAQLVDRLLADSRYGEHWARFWLDLVRYAESDGWNKDAYRPYDDNGLEFVDIFCSFRHQQHGNRTFKRLGMLGQCRRGRLHPSRHRGVCRECSL